MAGMALDGVADEDILAAVSAKGITGAATHFSLSRTTFRNALERRGLNNSDGSPPPPRPKTAGKVKQLGLTRESLHEALKPPNNCPVRRLLEDLDPADRVIVEEALSYDKETLSGAKLQEWLKKEGVSADLIPGVSAIADHRAGRRPCRCHD
jgi:hypothetical protein